MCLQIADFFANVPRFVYDHTAHGADSEWTIQRNRDAFDWVDIVARQAVEPAGQTRLAPHKR